MNKTLYISDLDGTLLSPDACLSDYTVRTLNKKLDGGVCFSVATARTLATVKDLVKNVRLTAPMVLMNGVLVYDPVEEEYINICYIGSKAVSEILKLIKELGLYALLYELDGGVLETYYENLDFPPIMDFVTERREKFNKSFAKVDFSGLAYDKIIYFMLLNTYDRLSPMAEALALIPEINFSFYRDIYTEDQWFLEIYSREASKGNGARFAAEYGGFDRVVGFGDNFNDLPLFEVSDVKVAVKNAVPELKEKADYVCLSNAEDGVARWLDERIPDMIRIIDKESIAPALELVNRVFSEFVAVEYSDKGKKSFEDYLKIKMDEVTNDIESGHKKLWGYFEDGEIIGVMGLRDNSHIVLFFVDKNHHKKGIGGRLFKTLLDEVKSTGDADKITVNASPYAVPIYRRLGFEPTDERQEKDGIVFIPMARPMEV